MLIRTNYYRFTNLRTCVWTWLLTQCSHHPLTSDLANLWYSIGYAILSAKLSITYIFVFFDPVPEFNTRSSQSKYFRQCLVECSPRLPFPRYIYPRNLNAVRFGFLWHCRFASLSTSHLGRKDEHQTLIILNFEELIRLQPTWRHLVFQTWNRPDPFSSLRPNRKPGKYTGMSAPANAMEAASKISIRYSQLDTIQSGHNLPITPVPSTNSTTRNMNHTRIRIQAMWRAHINFSQVNSRPIETDLQLIRQRFKRWCAFAGPSSWRASGK